MSEFDESKFVTKEEFDRLTAVLISTQDTQKKILDTLGGLVVDVTLRKTAGIDDDELQELRRLVVMQDGGDEMRDFHIANLLDRWMQVGRNLEEDSGPEGGD